MKVLTVAEDFARAEQEVVRRCINISLWRQTIVLEKGVTPGGQKTGGPHYVCRLSS